MHHSCATWRHNSLRRFPPYRHTACLRSRPFAAWANCVCSSVCDGTGKAPPVSAPDSRPEYLSRLKYGSAIQNRLRRRISLRWLSGGSVSCRKVGSIRCTRLLLKSWMGRRKSRLSRDSSFVIELLSTAESLSIRDTSACRLTSQLSMSRWERVRIVATCRKMPKVHDRPRDMTVALLERSISTHCVSTKARIPTSNEKEVDI